MGSRLSNLIYTNHQSFLPRWLGVYNVELMASATIFCALGTWSHMGQKRHLTSHAQCWTAAVVRVGLLVSSSMLAIAWLGWSLFKGGDVTKTSLLTTCVTLNVKAFSSIICLVDDISFNSLVDAASSGKLPLSFHQPSLIPEHGVHWLHLGRYMRTILLLTQQVPGDLEFVHFSFSVWQKPEYIK